MAGARASRAPAGEKKASEVGAGFVVGFGVGGSRRGFRVGPVQSGRGTGAIEVDGFEGLGLPLQFGSDPAGAEASNCFATATVADLVDEFGVKRVGSAQRWQNGRLLQHGEILLDPPADLWSEVFGEAAPAAAPAQISRMDLDQQLRQSLIQSWTGCRWQMQPLSTQEAQDLDDELASWSEL